MLVSTGTVVSGRNRYTVKLMTRKQYAVEYRESFFKTLCHGIQRELFLSQGRKRYAVNLTTQKQYATEYRESFLKTLCLGIQGELFLSQGRKRHTVNLTTRKQSICCRLQGELCLSKGGIWLHRQFKFFNYMKTVSILWNTRRVVYEQGKNWQTKNSMLGNTGRLVPSRGSLRLQGQFNSRKTASVLVITGSCFGDTVGPGYTKSSHNQAGQSV